MLAQVRPARQERHVHRRNAGEHRRPVVLEDRQRLLYLEAGKQYLLDAKLDAEEHYTSKTIDVEERQRADTLAACELGRISDEHVDSLLDIRNQVTVGEHSALRHTCRSARVLQRHNVLGGVYIHLRGWVGVRREEISEGAVPGAQSLRLAREVHDNDDLQVRIGQHRLHPLVHVSIYDDGSRAGVIKDVSDLTLYVHGVYLGDDGPEPYGREEGDYILGAIREHERDPISLLHPARRERGSHLLHEGLQPPELEGGAVEAERGLPAVLLDRARKQFVQRTLKDPRLRLDPTLLVYLEPRSLRTEHISSSYTAALPRI